MRRQLLDLHIKQLDFFWSYKMASSTEEIFLTEQSENLELLGRSPLVAEANMMKFPSEPPGRHLFG